MLNALNRREPNNVQRYVEIENAGHCPNHEAPQAVAHVVSSWVSSQDRREGHLTLVQSQKQLLDEPWGETKMQERREGDIKLSLLDRLAITFV
jgi:hypothetical protein